MEQSREVIPQSWAVVSRRGFITRMGGIASLTMLSACNLRGESGEGDDSSESEIVLGTVLPLSGAWAAGGENCLEAVRLAAQDFNEGGGAEGLNNAKVRVIEADCGSDDPSQAQVAAERLIRDGAVLLVGSYLSSMTLTASAVAERRQVPMLSQSFADELSERGFQYFFQVPPRASVIGASALDYLVEMAEDIEDVAIVASNDAANKALAEGTRDAANEKGFNVVYQTLYGTDLNNADAIVSQVKNKRPEILFLGGPLPTQILIVEGLRSAGETLPIVGVGGSGLLDPSYAQSVGEAAAGTLSVAGWNWDLTDETESLSERYESDTGKPFMPQEAGSTYVATTVGLSAIDKAGSIEAEAIASELRDTVWSDSESAGSLYVGGSVEFDDSGVNQVSFPVMIEYFSDSAGKPVTVWPEDIQRRSPEL